MLGSIETRRLAEVARAAGYGDSAEEVLKAGIDAVALLTGEEESPLLADLLRWQGSVLRDRGRTSEAQPLYERSLAVADRLHYEVGRAHALNCLGGIAQRRGDLHAAFEYFTEALKLSTESGEDRLTAMIQQNLAIVADIRGEPEVALAHYKASLRTFEKAGDERGMIWVLNNLGLLYAREGDLASAVAAYDRALDAARRRGDLLSEGSLEENRAELELERNDLDRARPSINRAVEVAEQRHDPVAQAAGLKLRGILLRKIGQAAGAVETLSQAVALSEVGEDALSVGQIRYELGMAFADAGQTDRAREVWRQALEGFERIGAKQWVAKVQKKLTPIDPDRNL